jgi:protein-tyrosine phosphatase
LRYGTKHDNIFYKAEYAYFEQEVTRVEGFVDIHTHILPGVDDGAQNLAQSVELLKMAFQQGTGAVILTPHYRGRYRGNTEQKLSVQYHELCKAAKKECPELELYLGCEVGYELDVSEKLADGSVLTLNGTRYVLLEFPEKSFRSRIMDGVLEVLNFGYTPIIAHMERYEAFHRSPELTREVMELGALIQLNADSILGKYGFGLKRYCRRLLKAHQVHFIATDAHDTKSRKPDLKTCYRKICKKFGKDRAEMLFYRNARVMLADGDGIEC